MSSGNIPLDVVSVIFDDLSNEPHPNPLGMQTLRACTLVCRAWRPVAQKRLLKKVVLVDPKSRENYYKGHSFRRYGNQPSLEELLRTMQNGSNWVDHIQVLHIYGRWVISHPDFSDILDIFAKLGRLRSFLWEMKCSSVCIHWCKFPEDLRISVEAVLSSPKLTSIRIHGICSQFPMETVGYSPLKHLEITGTQGLLKAPKPRRKKGQLERPATPTREPASVKAHVEYLNMAGCSAIMSYYNNRQDFRLDFSQLKELTFDNSDILGFSGHVIEVASRSLVSLSWTYMGYSEEYYEADPSDIPDFPMKKLPTLQALNIDAYVYGDYEWRFYNHLIDIIIMLQQCGIPNSLEILNIGIEFDPCAAQFEEDGPLDRLRWDVKETQFDSKLAELCLEAKSRGRLRDINLRILIQDWERDDPDDSRGEVDCDDDELETHWRDGYDSDQDSDGCAVENGESLSGRLEDTFPSLKATGMLHFEIVNFDEYISSKSSRDIW